MILCDYVMLDFSEKENIWMQLLSYWNDYSIIRTRTKQSHRNRSSKKMRKLIIQHNRIQRY